MAAVGLGVNQVLVPVAARRWGALKTTASVLTIAFVAMLAYLVLARLRMDLTGSMLGLLAILGVAAGVAYLGIYQGLRLGPVSVVSPIGATTGTMTVLFAFLFIGERLHPLQWLAVPVALVGAVLASLEIEPGTRIRLVGAGPLFAGVGVFSGAISNVVLPIPIEEVGAIQAIVLQRTSTVVFIGLVLVVAAAAIRARRLATDETSPSDKEPSALSWAGRRLDGLTLLIVCGLLDAFAFVSFARGLDVAPAWLIGLLSQSGRAIAVVGGLILFKERLQGSQWLGVGLVAAGVVLAVVG
jgi:drug/metabolite transporter (DMT)-like permease